MPESTGTEDRNAENSRADRHARGRKQPQGRSGSPGGTVGRPEPARRAVDGRGPAGNAVHPRRASRHARAGRRHGGRRRSARQNARPAAVSPRCRHGRPPLGRRHGCGDRRAHIRRALARALARPVGGPVARSRPHLLVHAGPGKRRRRGRRVGNGKGGSRR